MSPDDIGQFFGIGLEGGDAKAALRGVFSVSGASALYHCDTFQAFPLLTKRGNPGTQVGGYGDTAAAFSALGRVIFT